MSINTKYGKCSMFSLVQLIEHSWRVNSLAFSPNGEYLASGSDDNTIGIWNVSSAKHIYTLTGHFSGVSSVVFSPNGEYLAFGSRD